MSVADLLDRHGRVLTDRGEPLPLPAPRRPLSGRMRRTLVAVGSVLAAGSVLGGAVAVSTTGHEAPLGRTPGGLFDQLDPGGAESGGATYGSAPDGSATGAGPRAEVGVPTGKIGSADAGVIPAPRAAAGAATAPGAGGVPAVVVVPQADSTAADRTAQDRSAPAPTAARATVPAAPATGPTGDTTGSGGSTAAKQQSAPNAAPEEQQSSGDSKGTGIIGGLTTAVGDLLGG